MFHVPRFSLCPENSEKDPSRNKVREKRVFGGIHRLKHQVSNQSKVEKHQKALFGKTMENIRKRCTVEIVNELEEKKVKKLIAKPNYKSSFTFEDSNLISMRIGKTKVNLNKPVYLGASILDISKVLMYDFHYGYVVPKYGDRAQLLFTDTDSLCYELLTGDFFVDISPEVETMFDTSNFPKKHRAEFQPEKTKKSSDFSKKKTVARSSRSFADLDLNVMR